MVPYSSQSRAALSASQVRVVYQHQAGWSVSAASSRGEAIRYKRKDPKHKRRQAINFQLIWVSMGFLDSFIR